MSEDSSFPPSERNPSVTPGAQAAQRTEPTRKPQEPTELRYEHSLATMVYDRYGHDGGPAGGNRTEGGAADGNRTDDGPAHDNHTHGSANATSAPTFLLLHGIGMGRKVMVGLAEHLAQDGAVYALDLPGFGDSPEPDQLGTIELVADLVAEFIVDQQIAPVVLVGHSMGTQVAVELAVRHRDMVRNLVLIAPTINRDECTAAKQIRRLLQDLAGENPKVLLAGMRTYLRAGPWWLVGKLRTMLAHDVEATYPKVTTPTLVIRGELDKVCPHGWAQHVTDLIPDATLHDIAERHHEAMIRDPEPAADLVRDFLTG